MFQSVEPTAEATTVDGKKVVITGPVVPRMEMIGGTFARGCSKGPFLYLANGWLRYEALHAALGTVWINVAQGTVQLRAPLAEEACGPNTTELAGACPEVVQLNDRCFVGPHVTMMKEVGQYLEAHVQGLTAEFTRGVVVFATAEWSRDFSLMTGKFTGAGRGESLDVDALVAASVAAARAKMGVA